MKFTWIKVCHIKLVVDEADRDSIELVIGEAKLEMGKELTEYFMTDEPSLVYDNEEGVDLKIIFKRRLSNEVAWFHIYVLLMEINPRPWWPSSPPSWWSPSAMPPPSSASQTSSTQPSLWAFLKDRQRALCIHSNSASLVNVLIGEPDSDADSDNPVD